MFLATRLPAESGQAQLPGSARRKRCAVATTQRRGQIFHRLTGLGGAIERAQFRMRSLLTLATASAAQNLNDEPVAGESSGLGLHVHQLKQSIWNIDRRGHYRAYKPHFESKVSIREKKNVP
jgi:hypothetical protein